MVGDEYMLEPISPVQFTMKHSQPLIRLGTIVITFPFGGWKCWAQLDYCVLPQMHQLVNGVVIPPSQTADGITHILKWGLFIIQGGIQLDTSSDSSIWHQLVKLSELPEMVNSPLQDPNKRWWCLGDKGPKTWQEQVVFLRNAISPMSLGRVFHIHTLKLK